MKKLLTITLLSIAINCFAQIPTRGLRGSWSFNGNPNDLSGNNLHGTVNGALLTHDRFGNSQSAYSFNGTTSSIDIPLSNLFNFSSNDSFSISLWVKTNNIGNCQGLVVKSPSNGAWEYGLYLTVPNCGSSLQQPLAMMGKDNLHLMYSTTSLNSNWHHLVGVYKNKNWYLYVDNVLEATYLNYSVNTASSQISFGKKGTAADSYFSGSLDDIRIYNAALSLTEIGQLYYESCPKNTIVSFDKTIYSKNSQALVSSNSTDSNIIFNWQSNASELGWFNIPNNSKYNGVASKNLFIYNLNLANHLQKFRAIVRNNMCVDTSNTVILNLGDTCLTSVFDTTFITINDTIRTSVTDTLKINAKLTNVNLPDDYNLFKVYPNPTSTHIYVDNGDINRINGYSVKIINLLGQTVFSQLITQKLFYIDLSTLSGKGVYTLQIIDNNNKVIETKKIVVQ